MRSELHNDTKVNLPAKTVSLQNAQFFRFHTARNTWFPALFRAPRAHGRSVELDSAARNGLLEHCVLVLQPQLPRKGHGNFALLNFFFSEKVILKEPTPLEKKKVRPKPKAHLSFPHTTNSAKLMWRFHGNTNINPGSHGDGAAHFPTQTAGFYPASLQPSIAQPQFSRSKLYPESTSFCSTNTSEC